MLKLYNELVEYNQFLREFVLQQMRSRYRSSVLGFAWTLIMPLVTVASLGFVFAFISKADMRSFWPYFLGGFVPWTFFATAIGNSLGSVLANGHFVTRVYAPKVVFPFSAYLLALIEGAALAVAALVILALFGHQFHATLLFLPVSVAILLPFVLGVSLLVAAANVFFRDVSFLWGAFSTLLFFLTPIFYKLDVIPTPVRPLFEANPLYPIVRLFQDPLTGTLPPADIVTAAALYAAIALMIGAAVFKRSEKSFYLYL
jgi:ABC-2 type transport system permease protein